MLTVLHKQGTQRRGRHNCGILMTATLYTAELSLFLSPHPAVSYPNIPHQGRKSKLGRYCIVQYSYNTWLAQAL